LRIAKARGVILVVVETGDAETTVGNSAATGRAAAGGGYEDAEGGFVDAGVGCVPLPADVAAGVIGSDEDGLAGAILAFEETVESGRGGGSWTLSVRGEDDDVGCSWSGGYQSLDESGG